jgi:hypothetical protein
MHWESIGNNGPIDCQNAWNPSSLWIEPKRCDFIEKQRIYIGSVVSKSSIGKTLKKCIIIKFFITGYVLENDQMSICHKLKGLELYSVVTHYTFREFPLLFTYPGLLICNLTLSWSSLRAGT